MRLLRTSVLAALAVAALALSGCGSDSGGSGSGSGGSGSGSAGGQGTSGSSGSAGGKGTIKIGIKFDQPGLGLKSGSDYTGLDVDVARYVAGKLGYDKVDWIQAPSKQRETLIKSGQVTLVVATYSITDKRKQEVGFAGPYFVAGQSVLVRKGSNISGVADLKGKKVCSVSGSTSVENLKKQQPDLVPQQFDTYSKCVEALSTGVIDAITTDDTILAGFANQPAYRDKFSLVGSPFSREPYGVGMKKGDTTLCRDVTAALTTMIKEGSWREFVERNLGQNYRYSAALNPPQPDACA